MEEPINESSLPEEPMLASASSEMSPALPSLGILVGLGHASLNNLATFGHYHHVPSGTEIIREGEMQDRFYMVISGELAISAHCGGKEVALSTALPGECLGELSLLEPGPAAASIRVTKGAVLWSMDIEELRAYILDDT